jgi:hypothetical protein
MVLLFKEKSKKSVALARQRVIMVQTPVTFFVEVVFEQEITRSL